MNTTLAASTRLYEEQLKELNSSTRDAIKVKADIESISRELALVERTLTEQCKQMQDAVRNHELGTMHGYINPFQQASQHAQQFHNYATCLPAVETHWCRRTQLLLEQTAQQHNLARTLRTNTNALMDALSNLAVIFPTVEVPYIQQHLPWKTHQAFFQGAFDDAKSDLSCITRSFEECARAKNAEPTTE